MIHLRWQKAVSQPGTRQLYVTKAEQAQTCFRQREPPHFVFSSEGWGRMISLPQKACGAPAKALASPRDLDDLL